MVSLALLFWYPCFILRALYCRPIHSAPFLLAYQHTDRLRVHLRLGGNLWTPASHPTDHGDRGCLISCKYASSCPYCHIWLHVRSWRPEPRWPSQHFLDLVAIQPAAESWIVLALQSLGHPKAVEVHPWDSKYERYHLLNLSTFRVIRGLILRHWCRRYVLGSQTSCATAWLLVTKIHLSLEQSSIREGFCPWMRLSISSRQAKRQKK